jgi:hypothetical protein
MTASDSVPRQREGFVEFALVKQSRDSLDVAAWRASVGARLRMPRLTATALDPGLVQFAQQHRPPTFLPDGPGHADVKQATAPTQSLGFVDAAKVVSTSSFLPGTLLIPITAQTTRDVDPRTLRIFRWNPATTRHEIVNATGVNMAGGYVWARITRPGVYSVFGLMTPSALGGISKGHPETYEVMLLIILRLFSPTGGWESLGPQHLSCCIYDMAIDPSNSDRIYAAASNGGIWRLDSVAAYPGSTWIPVTDQQPSLAMTCMAVSPANSEVVYYVDITGQLYRSLDRGTRWVPAGSADLGYARRLLAHPTDPDTIYVASNRGFWCSNTGGASWLSNPGQSTLKDGDMTDAAMDPGDPSILYVTERSVGLHKSSSGGRSFQLMLPWSAATAPVGTMSKVAVGGLGTDANRTVAVKFDQEVFVNRHGGRGPSVLGGGPWTSLGQQGGTGYGDWCHVIAVDPTDDNVILAGAQTLSRTPDGGTSWTTVINYYAPHEDQHRILFDVSQPGVVYAANDGGVFRSPDRGITWQSSTNALQYDLTVGLVTAQFFTAAVSGDYAVGDAYHQGLLGASSLIARQWAGIQGHSWEFNNVYGDPVRPGTYYVFVGAALYRQLFPAPSRGSSGSLVQIGSFTPKAIAVDTRPGSNVLLAANSIGQVLRATNGDSASPAWTPMAGISLAADFVVSIAFAPSQPQQAYALTRDGRVFVCRDVDSSPTWTSKTTLPSPEGVALGVTADQEDQLYAISSSQVFCSHDGGGHWTAVPGIAPNQLPGGLRLVSIVTGPGVVYVAASSGVFTSPDAGQHWFPFDDGLPNVQIEELLWTESDLFAVTQGRGLWHHGRYDVVNIPPIAHVEDPGWLISLWLAIYGGDPAPDLIRATIGLGPAPLVIAGGVGD